MLRQLRSINCSFFGCWRFCYQTQSDSFLFICFLFGRCLCCRALPEKWHRIDRNWTAKQFFAHTLRLMQTNMISIVDSLQRIKRTKRSTKYNVHKWLSEWQCIHNLFLLLLHFMIKVYMWSVMNFARKAIIANSRPRCSISWMHENISGIPFFSTSN